MCGHEDYPCCGCGPEYDIDMQYCGGCGMPADECYCHECEDDYDYDYEDEDDYDEPDDNMTDVEADADTLRSAGWGTDEDYGYFGNNDDY